MSLPADRVQVFHAFTDRFDDPAQLQAFARVLNAEERQRHGRLRFERDRHVYLVAHAMVRSCLGRLTGLPPDALEFEIGEHGKPELSTTGGAPGLRFNLSHTHGLVACACAMVDDVGVDAEHRDRRVELEQVARGVFSPRELQGLLSLHGPARRRRFFELWTLKEAYIKAVGVGLSLRLRRITLDVEERGSIALDLSETDLGDGTRWQLALAEPGPEHQMALALANPAPRRIEWLAWDGETS